METFKTSFKKQEKNTLHKLENRKKERGLGLGNMRQMNLAYGKTEVTYSQRTKRAMCSSNDYEVYKRKH